MRLVSVAMFVSMLSSLESREESLSGERVVLMASGVAISDLGGGLGSDRFAFLTSPPASRKTRYTGKVSLFTSSTSQPYGQLSNRQRHSTLGDMFSRTLLCN